MADRIKKYKLLSFAAIFILIPLDSVSTLLAASKYGIEFEANQFMKQALHGGVIDFVLWKFVAGIAAGTLFVVLIKYISKKEKNKRGKLSMFFEIWIFILISLGSFVVANNFLAYFVGESLISIIVGLIV